MTQVTPAATFCATLVDSWVALGMTDAVICPGSRSTPMALALDSNADLRVQVHHDERSAAFLALGLGRATGRPAAVLTTSGTAGVNLHPAVAEAGEASVPLLALTADRPPELHGVGAPQTTDQQKLFGTSVRLFLEPGVPDETGAEAWRQVAAAAYAACMEPVPGPVQLNLPFREPLVGEPGDLPARRPEPWSSKAGGTNDAAGEAALAEVVAGARVLVVAGGDFDGRPVASVAAAVEWPVLADPRSRIVALDGVAHFDGLLRSEQFAASVRPEVVLRLGAMPASKVLSSWLDDLEAEQFAIDPWGRTFDPGRSLSAVLTGDPADVLRRIVPAEDRTGSSVDDRERWRSADTVAAAAIDAAIVGELSEPAVARVVSRCWGGPVHVSSSMPVRDLEWYGARSGAPVSANRGVNGIDGVISTAVGVALGSGQHAACLLGDVAFLHDHNGLLGLRERGTDLTVVVVDNDGGGIFGFLPQAEAVEPDQFDRLFGTPHGLDLVAVAVAAGIPATRVSTSRQLEEALSERHAQGGVGAIVVTTDRGTNVDAHRRIHTAIDEALSGLR